MGLHEKLVQDRDQHHSGQGRKCHRQSRSLAMNNLDTLQIKKQKQRHPILRSRRHPGKVILAELGCTAINWGHTDKPIKEGAVL